MLMYLWTQKFKVCVELCNAILHQQAQQIQANHQVFHW